MSNILYMNVEKRREEALVKKTVNEVSLTVAHYINKFVSGCIDDTVIWKRFCEAGVGYIRALQDNAMRDMPGFICGWRERYEKAKAELDNSIDIAVAMQ